MINVIRTDSSNKDFQELVKLLDAELKIRDGEDHAFYSQYNKIDKLNYVVVAYVGDKPVGCGAFKPYEENTCEIKRMYVLNEERKKGIALKVLNELEVWSKELGFDSCILETGIMQPEAIGLYQKAGYKLIPNYGQYAGVENSVCMRK